MAPVEICVEDRRFFRACTAGLSERTALVTLSVRGDITPTTASDGRLRKLALGLHPGEQLYGIAESDWPAAFLTDSAEPSGELGDPLRWLGGWLVALTVAIQRWGRDPVWRGRVRDTGERRMSLAMPWYRADYFDRSLELASRLITESLRSEQLRSGGRGEAQPRWLNWLASNCDAGSPTTLDQYLGAEFAAVQAGGLAPNTLRFIEAGLRRGMPFDVLSSFVQIGWGANARRFDMAATGQTSWIATVTAMNKLKANQTLAAAGIPVPPGRLVDNAEAAQQAADELGWPVVLKPVDQDGGRGVVPGIRDRGRLLSAFDQANLFSPGRVLVEHHCPGHDYRALVVGGRVLQVARRTAAQVTGDGVRSVRQLTQQLNSDPRRGTQRYSLLKVVAFDDEWVDCLAEQGLCPDSVPPVGLTVRLARIANISGGGTAEDVTNAVHPDNIALAERAARVIGLDIAGVDMLCPDIRRSWHEVGGVICEVNAQPGFRPHWLADPARDINGEVLDILFGGSPARIPTAAITGTNGKSTTAEMLYRIWVAAGKLTGVCTTARVRIGDETVSTDNLSGQPGARLILNDPAVESAVFEMPRKGLIVFGHQCDRYDVAALLNVQDDHIGVDGIASLEQMAELKAEVLARATQAIVVNAEDPLCLAMRARASTSRHILVARSSRVDALAEHRRHGGEAVFIDTRRGRPWIVIAAGEVENDLMPVHDVPATMGGLLPFNETNALFAAALAWAQGIDAGTIRRALSSFANSLEHNPGRYNFIEGLPFAVLVDFAHNPEGVRGICSVATAMPVTGRRLLCSLNVGSRHPGHVDDLAPLLASCFDEFVLSCDPKLVRLCPEYAGDDPAAAMVARSRRLLQENGVAPDRIGVEVDRTRAVLTALHKARPGDLVVLLADSQEAHRAVELWREPV